MKKTAQTTMKPAKTTGAKRKATSESESCCPLTHDPRQRLASDAQTTMIQRNFPKGVSQPALRALYAAGLMRLEDLTRVSEKELLDLHGMGPKAATILKAELKARGLDFRR